MDEHYMDDGAEWEALSWWQQQDEEAQAFEAEHGVEPGREDNPWHR